MIKLDPGKLALQIICTSHIHANILCRLRFIAVKSVAGVKHCPISPGYCPSCKYRCLQRAGVYERAREGWAYYGITIPPAESHQKIKECNK
jgi:hypothetical protein